MTPDSPNDVREDIAGAICDATGLRGAVWAVVSDVADEYALADAVMPVVEAETAQLRAELAAQQGIVDDTAFERVTRERDDARKQAAGYGQYWRKSAFDVFDVCYIVGQALRRNGVEVVNPPTDERLVLAVVRQLIAEFEKARQRPATEPAEATEPEMTGGPQWWRVTCCEAGQVAYPDPCPWHGTEGHPAAPATEPARPPATDYPDGLPERIAKSGCEATTWDRCLLRECDCGGYPAEPRVFRKGDPEPSDINQVKDDGDRRWCRNRADRSWYLRDIAGPFLMWDELLDRVGLLTEVPTEGGETP